MKLFWQLVWLHEQTDGRMDRQTDRRRRLRAHSVWAQVGSKIHGFPFAHVIPTWNLPSRGDTYTKQGNADSHPSKISSIIQTTPNALEHARQDLNNQIIQTRKDWKNAGQRTTILMYHELLPCLRHILSFDNDGACQWPTSVRPTQIMMMMVVYVVGEAKH